MSTFRLISKLIGFFKSYTGDGINKLFLCKTDDGANGTNGIPNPTKREFLNRPVHGLAIAQHTSTNKHILTE